MRGAVLRAQGRTRLRSRRSRDRSSAGCAGSRRWSMSFGEGRNVRDNAQPRRQKALTAALCGGESWTHEDPNHGRADCGSCSLRVLCSAGDERDGRHRRDRARRGSRVAVFASADDVQHDTAERRAALPRAVAGFPRAVHLRARRELGRVPAGGHTSDVRGLPRAGSGSPVLLRPVGGA